MLNLVCDYGTVDTPLPIPNREVKHYHGDNSFGKDNSLQTIFFFALIFVNF